MLDYEHSTDPVEAILDYRRQIVVRKQRAFDEAAAKKREWEERIAEVKADIEKAATAQASTAADNNNPSQSDFELASIGDKDSNEEAFQKETDDLHSMEEGDDGELDLDKIGRAHV